MGYVIEVIICSGLFILLYKTLLEGRIMHKAARAYLVSSIILSVAFPLIYPHPTAEEILGKWFYYSVCIVRDNRDLKVRYPEHYDRIVKGLDLTRGVDYVEFTKDGELLFVDGETMSAQKARYTYNPEDARLTIELRGIKYETFLNTANQGHLTAANYAKKYIKTVEDAGRMENNDPFQALKELEGLKEGMFAGVVLTR